MNAELLSAYRTIVAEITETHGEPKISVPEPVRVFKSEKITSAWFIGRINHGISVNDFGRYKELHGWNHRGPINAVLFSVGNVEQATYEVLLRKIVALVGLLP